MSLVGKVGRRRPRARIALATIYLLLGLGAITTLYPFVLMLVTGLKGPTDQNDNRLVPAYLVDSDELLVKYLDDKYSGNVSQIAFSRNGSQASADVVTMYDRFLSDLPLEHWRAGFRTSPNQVTGRLAKRYQRWLRTRYRGDIDALNRAYIEENVDFQTIQPPIESYERRQWRPTAGRKWDEWLEFKAALPNEFRVPLFQRRLWQEFLRSEFRNRIQDVPVSWVGGASTFEEIPLPVAGGDLWNRFVKESLPTRFATDSPEARWRASAGDADIPIGAYDARQVQANGAAVRSEFASRNYAYVLDYVLLNGRAVLNTILFCVLAIATQLIVNPLAAYALSRYPIRASGKILIFLLATMAFPAEVAMIPSFLLLKDAGLLNTFAALVLPAAASGYMIFLLKGFFDSLPQELFEAGQIDGARESTLMAKVALPLSKPVMGYLALLAFMGAYGAFLYAFLIAQDQKMWTLMVFIYQLQSVAPRSVMMAALTVAAVPTLLVFLLCQRVIMRGIVLPGER
jgi:multiple sugar transport system permease protein